MRRTLPAVVFLAACGGSQASAPGRGDAVDTGAPPEPVTRAVLAGPLCEGDRCTCRPLNAAGDGGAGAPTSEDEKRFEFHVGPSTNALWVTVDDQVLYKSDERAEECFYVDLRAGEHKVTIRASHGGGVSAALDVHEYSPVRESWYDTFSFNCGSPGVCAYDDLDAWKAALAKYERGLHDPCGSTKVKGITWDAGRAEDQAHPQDLYVQLTLDVYKFVPDHKHGDPACADRFAE